MHARVVQDHAPATGGEEVPDCLPGAQKGPAQVYGNDACAQVEQLARYALAAFSAGDTLRTHASVVRRLLKPPLQDTAGLRRQIAAAVLEREAYPWSA